MLAGSHEHAQSVVCENGVVGLGFVVESHSVGEAGTATLLDEQAKSGDRVVESLAVQQGQRLLGRVLRHLDLRAVLAVRRGVSTHAYG